MSKNEIKAVLLVFIQAFVVVVAFIVWGALINGFPILTLVLSATAFVWFIIIAYMSSYMHIKFKLDNQVVRCESSDTDLLKGASTREPLSKDFNLYKGFKKAVDNGEAAAIYAEYVKEQKADADYITYNAFQAGADWQAERMFTKTEMLDFAWFLVENVSEGGQYSNDRTAHFDGCYLEQFKKKINGN